MTTFDLPDLGEGLQEAEIVTWHVAEGDTVAVDDLSIDIGDGECSQGKGGECNSEVVGGQEHEPGGGGDRGCRHSYGDYRRSGQGGPNRTQPADQGGQSDCQRHGYDRSASEQSDERQPVGGAWLHRKLHGKERDHHQRSDAGYVLHVANR